MENGYIIEERNKLSELLNNSNIEINNEGKSTSFYGHTFLEEDGLPFFPTSLKNGVKNNIINITTKTIVKKKKKKNFLPGKRKE